LPAELLERIDCYASRLEGEPHLSVSRSDALHRLLTLALEDAENTAVAEAIQGALEPRVSWEGGQSRLRLTSSGARVLTYRIEFVRSAASVRGPITLFACLVLLDRSYNNWQSNLIAVS
jgi:hypothetical protein